MRLVLLDFEGTLFRGREPVPGAGEFLAAAAADANVRVVVVTNATRLSPKEMEEMIQESFGVRVPAEDIVDGAEMARRRLAGDGVRSAFVIGCPRLVRALRDGGVDAVTLEDHGSGRAEALRLREGVSAVIVALDFGFCFAKAALATRYVRERGCALYVVGNDTRVPWEGGEALPGPFALAAAVVTATGAAPVIVGKPEAVDVGARAGDSVVVVGDSQECDVPFAERIGAESVLVLTGATAVPAPGRVFRSLGEATECLAHE